jgi:hypothetical protein
MSKASKRDKGTETLRIKKKFHFVTINTFVTAVYVFLPKV